MSVLHEHPSQPILHEIGVYHESILDGVNQMSLAQNSHSPQRQANEQGLAVRHTSVGPEIAPSRLRRPPGTTEDEMPRQDSIMSQQASVKL